MAKIENHKYSIEEAFRECFYIVPDYQREFVWTDKEVQQLLDDIQDQLDDAKREYFIGMVLVSPTSEKNHYEVIDGQQRLTTLFLLLCALRQILAGDRSDQTISGLISTSYTDTDGDTRTSLKLEPRYENAAEIVALIASLSAEPDDTRREVEARGIRVFGSIENILSAYTLLHRHLKDNYKDRQGLKKYWGYLANYVVFIQISTDVSSALKIFETINERGVGLNSMDLLKNLLFTHVNLNEFGRLKNEWKKITKPLEANKQKALRFLRYFLMANYTIVNDRSDAIVREDEIYDWLTREDNAKTCGYEEDPFGFVRSIASDVDAYLGFAKGLGNDGERNIAMDNLRTLTGSAFSLHYVLLLAASPLPKPLFDHFVRQLESFLFFYLFTKTPTKDLERNFSVWADELRTICKKSRGNAQASKLNAFLVRHFKASMSAKQGELHDALKRYTLHSMQRYRTQYLLAKLTQHVDLAYKGLREPGSLAEYKGIEVEHILPNTPEPPLRESFGADRYDDYKVRLGNLTLLEKPINVVASNKFFELKKSEYRKCKYYLTSSIPELTMVGKDSTITRINKKLRSFERWTAESIEARQLMLVGLVDDIWRLEELGS